MSMPAMNAESDRAVAPLAAVEPFIPVQSRSERPSSTDVIDFPRLSNREPGWRYTPLERAAIVSDSILNGSPVPITVSADDGITVSWVDRADSRRGLAGTPEDRASASAWSAVEQVLEITVEGHEPKRAVIRRADLGLLPRAAHTLIRVAPLSQAVIVLEGSGAGRLSENVEIIVGDHSSLTMVSVQDWDGDAVHLASHFAKVGLGASLKHVVVTLNGALVRVNPTIHLEGRRSSVEAVGLYFAESEEFFEQQVYVHHDAAETKSRVTYKGALQGEGARTVWIGDVLISPRAVGTDSYEQNRNLILTAGARADSVPNLEIETGDIVGAGHASATGRFDDEQLFYLQSRGISEAEARRLVVRGFFNDVIQSIGDGELEDRLRASVEQKLTQGEGALLTPREVHAP